MTDKDQATVDKAIDSTIKHGFNSGILSVLTQIFTNSLKGDVTQKKPTKRLWEV